MLVDKRVSKKKKFLLVVGLLLAAGYVIWPVDLIPDAIPFVGTLDDFGAMTAVLVPLLNTIKRQMHDTGLSGSEKWVMGLSALYVISPIDFIPDAIPFLGTTDDWMAMFSLLIPIFFRKITGWGKR